MTKWYDPLTERWHKMPTPAKRTEAFSVPEGMYERAARIVREANIWEAVVASATSTQMSTEVEGDAA